MKFMKFIDRFNRHYAKSTSHSILYHDPFGVDIFYHNRDNLPSKFRIDGLVIWNNLNDDYHNINGPATTQINGYVEYWVNDINVTKFEAML